MNNTSPYRPVQIVALPGEVEPVIVIEVTARTGEISRVYGAPGGTPIPPRTAPAAADVQPIVIDWAKVEQIRADTEAVRRMFRPGIVDMRRVAQVRADTIAVRNMLRQR